jgi:hypothetical protein
MCPLLYHCQTTKACVSITSAVLYSNYAFCNQGMNTPDIPLDAFKSMSLQFSILPIHEMFSSLYSLSKKPDCKHGLPLPTPIVRQLGVSHDLGFDL